MKEIINMSKEELINFKNSLQKEKQKIEDKLKIIYEKLSLIKNNEDLDIIINNWTDSDENWKWLLDFSNGESNLKFQFLKQKEKELGITIEGYFNITKQRYIKISQYYNSFEGIKKLLPFIIPHNIDEFFEHSKIDFSGNYKIINVMANEEYTNYFWLIDEENKKYIVVDGWDQWRLKERKIFKTLEGSYKYIKEELIPVDKKEKEFDSDDYDNF